MPDSNLGPLLPAGRAPALLLRSPSPFSTHTHSVAERRLPVYGVSVGQWFSRSVGGGGVYTACLLVGVSVVQSVVCTGTPR